MEFFLELYKDLPKQGPGSDRITEKALSYIPETAKIRRILDAGCGSGRQTLVLAENTDADINSQFSRSKCNMVDGLL